MKYTVQVQRVVQLYVEVEADDPDDADRKVWDVIGDQHIHESADEIMSMQDEQGDTFVPMRHGGYERMWDQSERTL